LRTVNYLLAGEPYHLWVFEDVILDLRLRAKCGVI